MGAIFRVPFVIVHDFDEVLEKLNAAGVRTVSIKEFEYQLKVTGEEQANRLLAMLIREQIPVITFDLREPSLHEIFVEKVGHGNEME